MRRLLFVLTFVVLTFSTLGFGQSNLKQVYAASNFAERCGEIPDWDLMETAPYHPKFTTRVHPTKFTTRTFDKPTLWCMKTSLSMYKKNHGYGYVVMPAGSQAGFASNGKVMYLGTPDGQYLRCYNDTLGIWETEADEETFTPPQKPKVEYCKDSTMTITEAKERGYKVLDGRCTMPPVMCKDGSEMSQAEARERGYTVTADGRCIMPPRMCQDSDLTLAQAREKGYTVTDDGHCIEPKQGWSKKKKAAVWGGGACLAGIGLSALITRDFHPACGIPLGGKKAKKTTPISGSPTPDRPRVITFTERDKAYQAGSSTPSASQQSTAPSGKICGLVKGVQRCVSN